MSGVLAIRVPDELKELRRWVVWCLEERGGKPTKVPYSPLTGRSAGSTDPGTWGSYLEAIKAYTEGDFDGVGFVFTEADPFCGVDLDRCRDLNTGELEPWAREILDRLDSYSEISPSGEGVHIIVRGELPPGGNRRGRIEMYDRARFFTMTGDGLPDAPATVNSRQRELLQLHGRLFRSPRTGESANGDHGGAGGGFAGDDRELLERAMRADNGEKFRRLWDGDRSGYPSGSEADLALVSLLAFWTGADHGRIDRLFRQSRLYREKWERADYRERTIRAALARTDFYRGEGGNGVSVARAAVEKAAGAGEPPSTNGRGAGDRREAFSSGARFNRTDLGNAERFVAQHGQDVRYCYPWAKWLVWTGARWGRDDGGKVHRLAKETVRSIYREAAAAEDEGERKALAQHATRSEAEARIRSMLALAQSEVPVSPDRLDADPWLLNAENGTIDLRTGDLRGHRREDLITRLAPVRYDPDAAAPAWERFLGRVLPGEGLRAFVRRASGCSATGDTSEQCMFINHGVGNNGKSTFQEALAGALGDYAMRAPTEMLMAKRSGGVPNDVARLKGARFVTASETEEGRRLAESLVKDLTGQDTISARFMRAEWFDFKPTHKLWLSTNHKPEIRGTDNAIWRRIRLIPWAVTVPPAERDRKMPEKLRAELPGILTWVVRGCLEWRREGLRVPDEVRQATREYRAEMDVIAGFLTDCCDVGSRDRAYARELYAAYKRWCEDTGERAESQKKFGSRLKERGFLNDRDGRTGRSMWSGLTLNAEWTPRAEGSLNLPNAAFAGETELTEGSDPKNTINAMKSMSRGVMCKKGSEGSEGSGKDVREPAPEGLEELLAGPPEWLRRQAEKHLEGPTEATLKPLCAAVANEVLGNPRRGEEVRAAVERWLKNGVDGDGEGVA